MELDEAVSKAFRLEKELIRCTRDLEVEQHKNIDASRTANIHTGGVGGTIDDVKSQNLEEDLRVARAEISSYRRRLSALEEELEQSRLQIERMTVKEDRGQTLLSKQDALVFELEQKNSELRRDLNSMAIKSSSDADDDARRIRMLETELKRFQSMIDNNSVTTTPSFEAKEVADNKVISSAVNYEIESLQSANKFLQEELDMLKEVNGIFL